MLNGESIILVEGQTDKVIIEKIVRKATCKEVTFSVQNGIGNLLKRIKTYPKASGARRIGIIIDANNDLKGRWQSVCDRLRSSELEIELPNMPDRDGFMQECGQQRIGIWLIPDNRNSGMIEDFIRKIIPDDNRWELAVEFINKAMENGIAFQESKAKVYAWLAVVEPGLRLGAVMDKIFFGFDNRDFRRFESWICKFLD